jgi:hypothetical protein
VRIKKGREDGEVGSGCKRTFSRREVWAVTQIHTKNLRKYTFVLLKANSALTPQILLVFFEELKR